MDNSNEVMENMLSEGSVNPYLEEFDEDFVLYGRGVIEKLYSERIFLHFDNDNCWHFRSGKWSVPRSCYIEDDIECYEGQRVVVRAKTLDDHKTIIYDEAKFDAHNQRKRPGL